ncbi:hypothetical protein DW109_08160 [Coprobacillus sp. AM09-26]|nr:hypothetical protein DW109_08160 [Coprobacillus sp. AM09-26]
MKKGEKIMKKIIVMLLSLMIMTSVGTMNVSALESVNNNIYYDEKGNYDNPETGEYFHWDNSNARSTAKSFSFKIRYSLKSGSFKLKGTNSKIRISNATFVYASGSKASCCSKHRFTVNLRRDGLSNNEATFYAPFTSAKTVSLGGGFSTSSSYLVEISNNDNLPSGIYLSGSGTVEN